MHDHYDLVVIGAGSGGVRAARMAAQQGVKVAIVESGPLGGTCVNVGCIPKKFLVYASAFNEQAHLAQSYGWNIDSATIAHDWQHLIQLKNTEISRLNGIYKQLLDNAEVTLYEAKGQIEPVSSDSPVTINLESANLDSSNQITASKVLVATGTTPTTLPVTGTEYLESTDDMFYWDKCPEKIVILGAGYIAVECAFIFAKLGSQVTLALRGDKLLKTFDQDISNHVEALAIASGIDIQKGVNLQAITKESGSLVATFDDGSTYTADKVLGALGRKANFSAISDIKRFNVTSNRLIVDNRYQTSVPNVYALGDIIGGLELTPVAIAEAMHFVRIHFEDGGCQHDMRPTAVPTAVFSQPSVGSIGLTEAQARAEYNKVEIYQSQFRKLLYTLDRSVDAPETLIKLIVDSASRRVVGIHIIDDEAAELIQILGVAVSNGLTKEQFDQTVAVHPTMSEELVTLKSFRS